MQQRVSGEKCQGLPPLVGTRLLIISHGLERAYDRARGLDELGYKVAASGDPHGAVGFVVEFQPDVIVVDLGRESALPAEVVTRVRDVTNVPMVVIGCAGTLAEMLRCYEAGADEYCRPPAQTDEIDLRLRAIFRRVRADNPHPVPAERAVMRIGDLEIDTASHVVRKRGDIVSLSPTEFRLLVTLAERRGEVVPSKALIARVWGQQYAGETHYLRLYVRYLRQKLEDDPSHPTYIVNRWGSGYALEEPPRAA